jgi:rhodanese-related sulfurtransferase
MARTLTPQQANELLSHGDIELIDVREPSEWSGGHIPGARLVPLEQLRAGSKSTLVHDAVIFVCAAGTRSQTAARIAEGWGHAKVYNMSGGIRSWAKAGLPLVKELLSA